MAESEESYHCQMQIGKNFSCDTMVPKNMTRREKKRCRQSFKRECYNHRVGSTKRQLIYSFSGITYRSNRFNDEKDNCYDQSLDYLNLTTEDMMDENLFLTDLEIQSFELARNMDDVILRHREVRRRKHLSNSRRKLNTKSVIVERRCRERLKDVEEPQIMTARELLNCILTKKLSQTIGKQLSQKICKVCLAKQQQHKNLKDNIENRLMKKGLKRFGIQIQNGEIHQAPNSKFVLNKATSNLQLEKNQLNILESLQYRDITPEDYELLLQLDSDNKPKTLSIKKVSSIPTITISHGNSEEECSICMESFIPKEVAKVLPRCKHIFHEMCITTWLTMQSTKCPLDQLEV